MTDSMDAYVLRSFDAPPAITQVAVPEPAAGQVRVRVRASSVNPVDAAVVRGFFRAMTAYRLPAVQGRDFAGTVDEIGEGVTTYSRGDEVFGMVKRDYIGDGTFAEYVVVDADRFLVPRPPRVSVADAGAMGLAGTTALQCIDELGVAEGGTVFINGATGGVGSFAIQIAVARGLRVVATARPGAEEEHVRALGASDAIDWSTGDAAAAVLAFYPDGVEGVVDLVSRGADSFAAIARAAAAGGTAVTTLSAAASDRDAGGPRQANIHSDSDPALLERLGELVASGAVRVPIVATYPLGQIDEAFALLATGPTGKVALAITP